jgi:hypothetical protein
MCDSILVLDTCREILIFPVPYYTVIYDLSGSTTSLHIYLLTYSMEQSPSLETNWFAASQEIPRVLWNPKVPHRTHKSPPPAPILSKPNPVLTPTSHFLKIHPNIILPYTPRSPQRSLSLRFPHQNPVHTSPFHHTCYMPRLSQYSRFYHPQDIG